MTPKPIPPKIFLTPSAVKSDRLARLPKILAERAAETGELRSESATVPRERRRAVGLCDGNVGHRGEERRQHCLRRLDR